MSLARIGTVRANRPVFSLSSNSSFPHEISHPG